MGGLLVGPEPECTENYNDRQRADIQKIAKLSHQGGSMKKAAQQNTQATPVASRRKFLSGATAATAGAALAFPMIARGQTKIGRAHV